MKTEIKKTPLALAIAALMASPFALAQPDQDDWEKSRSLSSDTATTYGSFSHVELWKGLNVNVSVDAHVEDDEVSGPASAVVTSTQRNGGDEGGNFNPPSMGDEVVSVDSVGLPVDGNGHGNVGINYIHENDASIEDDAASGAAGNIGLNSAAGDSNQQANDAALAASDAEFVFADAETFSTQDTEDNLTLNHASSNRSVVGGSALSGASGNIGVNVASGNNNQQQNSLAVSVASDGPFAVATASGEQFNDGHTTMNTGIKEEEVGQTVTVSLSVDDPLSGEYDGTSDQIGDVYPDVWEYNSDFDADEQHPNSDQQISHFDLDTETQGGSDLNDDGGALAFNELGDVTLDSGSLTGTVTTTNVVYDPTTNDAHIQGSALSDASGNIGMNVAAGSNNQQRNQLSIARAQGTDVPTGGGE
ncbi:MAG TPA: hypothetical protein VKA64_10655 [Gammaproteobacteria bacterium]|nr:hypothetical protein [Gammaproteobacteria bacterium]